MPIGRNAKTCVNHNHWSTDYKFDSTMNFTTIMLGHKKRQVRLQADDGRGMTPCHEQSLMAFDVKGNSQLLAKYVMEILRERLALKKDKVAME